MTKNPAKPVPLQGLFQRDALGVTDGDHPEIIGPKRWGGYPWPPYEPKPAHRLPGASGVGKMLDGDPGALMQWLANMAITIAAKHRKAIAQMNQKDAIAVLKELLNEERSHTPAFGNYFHGTSALVDCGYNLRTIPAGADYTPEMVANAFAVWEHFKKETGMVIGAAERTLYPEVSSNRYSIFAAGTADRIVRFENLPPSITWAGKGSLFVLDLKTKKRPVASVEVDASHVIQAGVLSHAKYIAYEEYRDTQTLPIEFAGAVIVYVCTDGVKAFFVRKDEELEAVTVMASALAQYAKDWRNTVLAQPIVQHAEDMPDYKKTYETYLKQITVEEAVPEDDPSEKMTVAEAKKQAEALKAATAKKEK